jgi:hypothetical protein
MNLSQAFNIPVSTVVEQQEYERSAPGRRLRAVKMPKWLGKPPKKPPNNRASAPLSRAIAGVV